jgi:hypothetical protein
VAQAAHDGAAQLGVEDFLLGHEAHLAAPVLQVGRQSGEGEVEVTGVVDGDHRAPGDGEILDARDGELQSLQPPHQAGRLNDCSVNRFHSCSA